MEVEHFDYVVIMQIEHLANGLVTRGTLTMLTCGTFIKCGVNT
jgi:hypothetical protein